MVYLEKLRKKINQQKKIILDMILKYQKKFFLNLDNISKDL